MKNAHIIYMPFYVGLYMLPTWFAGGSACIEGHPCHADRETYIDAEDYEEGSESKEGQEG